MWGHPDQEEGPLAFSEKREAALSRMETGDVTFSTYDTLKLERHGPVGWLINNRPEQLNAMNSHMRDEFADAWLELDADPAVKVIVHTGEGRAFQTGVDVDGDRHRRRRAWSATASRSRTGTCTSPPGSRASTSR